MQRKNLSAVNRYGVALASVALATALRMLLDEQLGDRLPFAFFLGATIFIAWYAGLWPSVLALTLGAILGVYLSIPHGASILALWPTYIPRVISYLVIGFVSALFIGALRRQRSRAEATARMLDEHKEWFRVSLSSIGDGVIVTNREGLISFINPAAEAITGWNGQEATGRPLSDVFNIVDEQTRAKVEDPVAKALGEGGIVGLAGHTLLIARDGREVPIDDSGAPIRAADGKMIGVVLVFRDITERELANKKLRESEERYRIVAETASDAIITINDRSEILFANRSAERVFGYKASDMLGQSLTMLMPEYLRHLHRQGIERYIETGRHHISWEVVELPGLRKDGREIPLEISFSEFNADDKRIFIGIIRDITERKRAEEALKESEERYRELFENANDIIYTLDLEGNLTSINKTGEHITGYARQEVLNRSIANLLMPGALEMMRGVLERKRAGEALTVYEIEILAKDGRKITLEVSSRLIYQDGEPVGVQGIARDITDRKQAVRELDESRERLAGIIDSAMDSVITIDESQRIILFNYAAEAMFRCSAAQAIGQPIDLFIPDRFRASHRDHISNFGETKVTLRAMGALGEIRGLRANGDEFPIEASISQVRSRGQKLYTVILRDITERKQAEAERARLLEREQAARAEAESANRAKDEFLATVSHELRTPLNSILGWAHILRRGQIEAEAAERALETIERNAKAQAQLVEDILDVSRIVTGKLRLELRPVEVAPIIEAAVESVRPAADAKAIRIEIKSAGSAVVSGDSDRLRQVVWNLLSNAVKFTPEGGHILVSMSRSVSHAEVEVADTGQGMSRDFLPYVFERFRQADSSTTRKHGGLGLGLAIVRHLVEMHGGSVRAESLGAGHGATFTVRLPLSRLPITDRRLRIESATEDQSTIGDRQSTMLEDVRVLVVDDEPDTLEMLVVALTQYGAQVHTCARARETLDILGRWKPNVLVSDIQMPDEDGYELIGKIRALDSSEGGKIPAVALTAYARKEDRIRALSAGYDMHLSKPVEPAELAVVIANLMERTDR
jgi:PAS domain S-box-containing protein